MKYNRAQGDPDITHSPPIHHDCWKGVSRILGFQSLTLKLFWAKGVQKLLLLPFPKAFYVLSF